ncbi:hypothetical protein BH09ACT10_BH09ACT10_15350 [soil metagenome]
MSTLPGGLMDAFWSYEAALMSNDLAALDRLFADRPTTWRGDAAGLLVGHAQISGFRGTRGGAPQRTIVSTDVQVIDDHHALIVAVTEPLTGGRGLQTQLWELIGDAWAITAAHVSASPAAFDSRIWRVVGDPLLAASTSGPLDGEAVAVKDLYAVAGHLIGGGSEAWLAQAKPEPAHAWAVGQLLAAGAHIRGIARTDEFAYSLAGVNSHYGVPPNPKAPYRISGGSSSGSATAVSLGHATIGLGTDTGGSIRVPAAYQGLFGIRTTHGAVSMAGLVPLAPSFDTVGWLTRDAALLGRVADALLRPATPRPIARVLYAPSLLEAVEAPVREAMENLAGAWPDAAPPLVHLDFDTALLPGWLAAFQTAQAFEAWQSHGAWLQSRMDTLGADVRGRFERASGITQAERDDAWGGVLEARAHVRALVGDDAALLLPSASSVAPLVRESQSVSIEALRTATLRLTCLAGNAGLPAVSMPLETAGGLPAGACFVAGVDRDRDLIDLAQVISAEAIFT